MCKIVDVLGDFNSRTETEEEEVERAQRCSSNAPGASPLAPNRYMRALARQYQTQPYRRRPKTRAAELPRETMRVTNATTYAKLYLPSGFGRTLNLTLASAVTSMDDAARAKPQQAHIPGGSATRHHTRHNPTCAGIPPCMRREVVQHPRHALNAAELHASGADP